MVRDDVAVNNERLKMLAGFANALGVGLIGLGVIAPLVGDVRSVSAPGTGGLPQWPLWLVSGLAMHGTAHYVLGYLKKAGSP